MAEVFLQYQTPLFGHNGRTYRARACGGKACDRTDRWHGWIEFWPLLEDGSPIRTARETTQPDRTCTVYWSTGLTPVYLQGALERALRLVGVWSAAGARSSRATARRRGRDLTSRLLAIDLAPRTVTANPRLELTRFDRWFLRSLVIAPG